MNRPRKTVLILFLLLVPGIYAVASDQKVSLGLSPEFNMNSRKNFAGGLGLHFDYNFPIAGVCFAAGAFVNASTNFSGFGIIEPAALFRWYFPGGGYAGGFLQADLGISLIPEDGEVIPLFLGGIRGGYRFPIGEMMYVEPFGRFGYPFMFGIGVVAGLRLGSYSQQAVLYR